jgi:molybdenum cofactor cytidylyltransferase
MSQMKISAIVLAAGESRRMGTNKLLLDVGGQALVERVVNALLRSAVDRVIVVAGFERQSVQQLFKRQDVRVVYNRQYQEGMASSIREGLRHLSPDDHGVLIALADHPFLRSQIVDRLIETYRKTRRGIVCPTYQGKRGHPVVFNVKRYAEPLSRLQGDIGGRTVIEAHEEDVVEVAVDSPAVIMDIDSWEDYKESLRVDSEELLDGNEEEKE